jgi:choice-of-anchor B domain-containing protein
LGTALACFAGPAWSHDGDLKALHKKPAQTGASFRNAVLRTPDEALGQGPTLEMVTSFPSSGVTLLSWMPPSEFGVGPGGNVNSLWGYTSPGGRQYVLLGHSNGTAFVEVTTPSNPVIVGQIPGIVSFWRDVRTYDEYGYSVSEGPNEGIQVFDLTQIDSGTVSLARVVNDIAPSVTHTLSINETSGYLYRSGGGTVGLRIYDLNPDPSFPSWVSTWNDRYVHETSVFTLTGGPSLGREIAFACGGFNGGFDQSAVHILDVTDKLNILTKDIEDYPSVSYCHQAWLSPSELYLYINDEFYNGTSTTVVLDVSDLNDTAPRFVSTFTNGNDSAAHNLYVHDQKIFMANYRSGLRVWDISVSETAPTEIAWFDTDPDSDERTFNSLWNVYPYFGNGLVVGSDIERGLFVWYVGDPKVTFDLTQGAPLEVEPINTTFPFTLSEDTLGDYDPGTAKLHYDTGSGFVSVALADLGGLSFKATLPGAQCGSTISYYLSADSTDGTVWTEPAGAPSVTYEATVTSGFLTSFTDDFELDLGWTAANLGAASGDWERGVPVDDPAEPYDPASDSDGSGQCWLTDNTLGVTGVVGGAVSLTSPTLDLTQGPARISYDYYLWVDHNIEPVDKILVEIDENDGVGPWVEIARHPVSQGNDWRPHTITENELIDAGVTRTATMRVRFTVNEGDRVSTLEAGLDAFQVEFANCSGSSSFCDDADGSLAGCPCSPGDPDTGCDIQQQNGGVLMLVSAQETSPQNRVTINGFGFPAMNTPAALVIRGSSLDTASPVAFGDGIRCVSAPIVRLGAAFAIGGVSNHTFGHGSMAGSGTFYYQLWFRNTPSMYCTPDAFNLSNGQTLTW